MLTDDVFYGMSAGCGLFGRSLGENSRLSVPQGHGHLSALATEDQAWLTFLQLQRQCPIQPRPIFLSRAPLQILADKTPCCTPDRTSAFGVSRSVIRHEICSKKRTSTFPVMFRLSSRCMMRNLEKSFGFWWMSKALEATLFTPVLHVCIRPSQRSK